MIEETLFAHRIHKDVFIQDIEIRNSGKFPVTIQFSMNSFDEKHFKFSSSSSSTKNGNIKYSVLQDVLKTSIFYNKVHIVMSVSDYQKTIRVPQKSKNKVNLISVAKFEFIDRKEKKNNKKRAAEIQHENQLVKSTTDALLDIVNIKSDTLSLKHIDSWDDIWKVRH